MWMRESGQRARTRRATKNDNETNRRKQRKGALCSSPSVDSLLSPEPVMTTGSGCQSDSDKPLKDPPPLSMDPRKRDGFHAACLNWPCALNINTSQTLSLSLCCCLQGCWQTHGQIRPPVRVSPQPSINRHPGVCSRVFFLRRGRAGMSLCDTSPPSTLLSLHKHTRGRNLHNL